MILIELVVIIIVLGAVAGLVVAAYALSQRFQHSHTLEGKIDKKRGEITDQKLYIDGLTMDIEGTSSPVRKEMLETYRELAGKKKDQLEFELEAMRSKKEQKKFEERMKID